MSARMPIADGGRARRSPGASSIAAGGDPTQIGLDRFGLARFHEILRGQVAERGQGLRAIPSESPLRRAGPGQYAIDDLDDVAQPRLRRRRLQSRALGDRVAGESRSDREFAHGDVQLADQPLRCDQAIRVEDVVQENTRAQRHGSVLCFRTDDRGHETITSPRCGGDILRTYVKRTARRCKPTHAPRRSSPRARPRGAAGLFPWRSRIR